jgi:hypothetical protein
MSRVVIDRAVQSARAAQSARAVRSVSQARKLVRAVSSSRAWIVGWSCAGIAVWAACASAPPPPPPKAPAPISQVQRASEPPPQCVDDKDQRVQCLSDSDCCPRFVCGKDPDLSQAVSYCIFGG